ncbi:MAG TPA: ferritin family protein, partial [Burkholderiaceae bacterium]|nr:ferritin family protein [Burkholderiaceae bacterium]
MRESLRDALLLDDPGIGPVDMQTLVGIAAAIEHESVRRYAMLADAMESRGEIATAAAFRVMCEEERKHVEAVDHWAESLNEPVPSPQTFQWTLPPELSTSWDDAAGSALLTPYRAFSIAVVNEQRAFSFYTYLAAHATGERVRIEAERMAGEELRHAALMRQWRREAWHRARRETPRTAVEPITSLATLREALAEGEIAITRCHDAVARRLRDIGDNVSAQVVEQQLGMPSVAGTAASFGERAADARVDTDQAGEHADAIAACEEALPLLVIALKPLEALGERLEATMASAEGALFDEAAQAMDRLVKRLSRIGLRVAH